MSTRTPPTSLRPVLRALEHVWTVIRERHREVPAAVIGRGTSRRTPGVTKLGSWGASRWVPAAARPATAERQDEVMIAGEGLAACGLGVLDTLLHEATHGLCDARGIQETSRRGQYHNRRFKAVAEELGLEVTKPNNVHGFNQTSLAPATRDLYADQVAQLDEAIGMYRLREDGLRIRLPGETAAEDEGDGDGGEGEDKDKPPKTRIALVCSCESPRKLYIAPGVADLGGIRCEICGELFGEADDEP